MVLWFSFGFGFFQKLNALAKLVQTTAHNPNSDSKYLRKIGGRHTTDRHTDLHTILLYFYRYEKLSICCCVREERCHSFNKVEFDSYIVSMLFVYVVQLKFNFENYLCICFFIWKLLVLQLVS